MKRSSPTGSEDSQPDAEDIETKRKKLCEFESVRLPAVAGVNDIDEKKSRVQVYKLSETLRFKDKIIAQKDRELEQLRQRQYTDENTSYQINRWWNSLDEQLRNIVLRGSNPSDVNQLLETNGDASSSFLEEIVQMNEEERQNVYKERVNTSVRHVQQIVQANAQRTEQLKTFMGKMNAFMSEKGSREDTMNELVHQNALLTDENARLTKDCNKMHQKYSECKSRLREETDKVTILQTKVEEQTKDLNDLKHDLDKANRMVNKLDFKLWSEIRERRSKVASISEPTGAAATTSKINGTTDYPGELLVDNEANGCSSKQVEELRSEVESATELASSRLNEINELHERLRKKSEELELIRLRIGSQSEDQDSALTKELRMFLTMAIEELQKKTTHEVSLIEETDLIRVELGNCEDSLKAHYDRAVAVFQEMNSSLETENEELREEVDRLVHELEENRITLINAGVPEHKDIRTLRESYKAQINQLKSEALRMRKKWKESVNALLKNSKELDVERKKNENFFLVPLVAMDDLPEDGIDSANQERFMQLKKENLGLRAEIQRLRELDDTTRKIIFEAEFKEKLAEKDMKIHHLNGQIDSLSQGDESITQEMESIGQALEDLQEQNADLIRRSGHHEEERMKMMGDKIASKQLETKLKEETAQWETKAEQYKHQVHCTQLERQYFEEAYKAYNTLVNCRSREAALVRSTVEILRKQTLEKAVELSQVKNDKEKLAAQVKSVQDTILSKNRQYDTLAQKLRRLEEENNLARKQLDRAKLSEKLGSTDAVMSEENRQLKEALTCPSCKVNRKDAILTKCFHVFCMDCLKTRYETRQRKCPKCNAGFGANDFQRAYIG